MLQTALLYFSGVMLPLEALTPELAAVARVLPATQGIAVLRELIFAQRSLGELWADGAIPWLIVHSALYFALGWLVYKWCESIAKRQGSLGPY